MFWLAMERGASLIVAAEPPSAGKTATLTALLALTPPETLAYFTRGMGETFSLPPLSDSHPTYILVNEMSDHLPVYTWDSYARRAFELLDEGYSLATTVHAENVQEVLSILRHEIGVPARQVSKLTFIVPLHLSYSTGGIDSATRRVSEVAFFEKPSEEMGYRRLAHWDQHSDSFSVLEAEDDRRAFASWCGLSAGDLGQEMDRREAFLERLAGGGASSIPEVTAAIERFYAEEIRPRR